MVQIESVQLSLKADPRQPSFSAVYLAIALVFPPFASLSREMRRVPAEARRVSVQRAPMATGKNHHRLALASADYLAGRRATRA